ncbi:6-bladed beta-propeller [Longimicrobium terrae]|uniref:6-bladed beta-propeller n=1 Tax=Longimicrobium terrae TaxID=1639882 RepID=UPI001613FBE7|nr:6-bladed beta-propeller [Longimicrobium terrae]
MQRKAGPLLILLFVCAGGLAVHTAARRLPAPEGYTDPALSLPDVFHGREQPRLTVPGVPDESVFGLVGDVAMARDGRTFVLDVLNHHVGVFSASGERSALLGGRGGGPGEFMGPVALAWDDAGTGLYVLDERRQGIDVFDPADGTWRRTIPLDFHAADLCYISGRLYVLGGRKGFLLHEVSSGDGRVLRSFAPDAASEDILLRGYRASGYLGCRAAGEIAFLPSLRPEVLRFSAVTGALIGTAPIPGYRPVRVRPTADGGMRFDVPGGGGHDYGSAVVPLGSGDWLVQVGRLKKGTNSQHEFDSVRSYLLSRGDGRIRPLEVRLPRVMAAAPDRFSIVETSPFPAVSKVPASLEELLR